jgi:hypothetical protein
MQVGPADDCVMQKAHASADCLFMHAKGAKMNNCRLSGSFLMGRQGSGFGQHAEQTQDE